jgi:hypothetical protein
MLVFENSFPLWALISLLVCALALGAFSAWRFLQRRALNALLVFSYLLVLGGMAWCMLLPGLRNTVTQVRKPRFIVALDTSQSMSLTPAPDVPTRWSVAQEAFKRAWFGRMKNECEVDFFSFDAAVSEGAPQINTSTLTPTGTATRLRHALKKIAEHSAGANVAGMLLLSDGTDTSEAHDDWAGVAQPYPVYTLRLEPPGGWKQDPDLRIDAVTTSRRVTLGWKSELKVKISGQGTRGQSVTVQLYKNGALHGEIPTQIPDEGGEREVSFELEHPKMGSSQYRVYVPPIPGEIHKEDNEESLSVEVVDARNRLLYLEGVPRWEYKYLRRVLLAERQVSSIIFFTGPDGAPQGGTPVGNVTADMTSQQLAYFKIVMLGNIDAKELGAARAKNLVKFVEEGGSLILLGGARGWNAGGLAETELGKILPVRGSDVRTVEGEKPYPVKLAEAARAHPAFAGDPSLWQNIPPILSLFTGFSLSPGAETLVTAQTPVGEQPVVATQRFGQGKVTAILTDSLWRWQLGPEAGKARPYERFWTQLVSWLLPRQESLEGMRLEFFSDREQVFLGESIDLNARFGNEDTPRPEGVEARITLPDKREIPYRMAPQLVSLPSGKSFPGFTASFSATQPGLYQVSGSAKLKGQTYSSEPFSFFVKPHSPETVPRPAKPEVLQAISTASGGRFFESVDDLNEHLRKLHFHTSEQKLSDYRTLWREWPSIIVLMTLLSLSWGLRKSQNLP